jgi:hypothetical protein
MDGVLSGWGGAVKPSTVGERVERALGNKNRRRRTAELLEVLRHAFRQLSRDGAMAIPRSAASGPATYPPRRVCLSRVGALA